MLTRPGATPSDYRHAMRQLAGGVCVVTMGRGDDLGGLTATSVVSVSADPPALLFSINRDTKSYDVLVRQRVFVVNILDAAQQSIAEAFSGRTGDHGALKFGIGTWSTLTTGAPVLEDAMAALDCEVDDIIERAANAIVIGTVKAVRMAEDEANAAPLSYWRGLYRILK